MALDLRIATHGTHGNPRYTVYTVPNARQVFVELDILMHTEDHHDVRTTLTIDDDLAPKIEDEMRRSGASFKETVNRLLRLGLLAGEYREPAGHFRVRARPLGARSGLDFDNIGDLIETLEGPEAR